MARPENVEHDHEHDTREAAQEETPLEAAPTELAVEASAGEETQVEETQIVETHVEPAPPKVTTRSRRRSAPRPAAEPAPVVVPAEPVVAEPVVAEPVAVPVVEAVAPPEPPKVITRTRGRSATRPAGPPVEVSAEDPVVTTGDEDGDHPEGEHPHVEHVPIKKKGSRKR